MRHFRAIVIIVSIFCCAVVGGCKSPAAVVPLVHNSNSERDEVKHKQDSVFIDRWHTRVIKGDTVYLHDSIYIEKWREMHDTLTVSKTDSIPYPVEVQVEVEKPLTNYQIFMIRSGWVCWILIAILFILAAVWFAIKIRRAGL